MIARSMLLPLLASALAKRTVHAVGIPGTPGYRPPWATPTVTASAGSGSDAITAACAGVSTASTTAYGGQGNDYLSVSCEIVSQLSTWLAPLLTGGPLPAGASLPARAASGSTAAAAAVELAAPCASARVYPALTTAPACMGPSVNVLVAGGRCELRDDGGVACVGPAVTATAAPPRCSVATGGTLVVDAHCGAPGDPLFGGAENALASFGEGRWGAPVASGAGLAAALAAAGTPARLAGAAAVVQQGGGA